MTPSQLRALLMQARTVVNNLTLNSIVLNGTINDLINALDVEDSVEDNEIGACTDKMSSALNDFCDTLEKFQKLAWLLSGGNDEE